MTISGGVTIMTECFTLDAGATITGVGNGYQSNFPPYGPGAGTAVFSFAAWPISGGGGHGGAGATDHDLNCMLAAGGAANDDPVHPSLMGSAAEPDCGGPTSGGGGALLRVIVYDPVANVLTGPSTIMGTIDMSGLHGNCGLSYGDGGGAGGTIFIESNIIAGSGALTANGASFSGSSGGGGGGGIVSLIENLTAFSGTISVLGGGGAANGTVGCTPPSTTGSNGIVTFTAAPSSGY